MLSRVFFLALTLSFIAAPVMSTCPSSQFCSRCPRKDNVGHTLQAEPPDAGYVHCQYQDTDCYYGPKGGVCRAALSSHTELQLTFSPFRCRVVMKTTSLSMGFPANACPPALVANVCSAPIAPQRNLLDTACPFSNNNFINVPLRSEHPAPPPGYVQCHYSSSECYYNVCFIHSDDHAYR
jgi:hypothetical protein